VGIELLSALKIKALKKPGYHCDGGGLYVQVSPALTKSWIFRFRWGPKQREMGLGSLDLVSLAEARQKAYLARKQVADGIDPIAVKRSDKTARILATLGTITFDAAVKSYIEAHGDTWKNAKHRGQWETTLRTYASPVIGLLPVGLIQLEHVLRILEPIWKTKNETASRLRGRIESVLDWCRVRKYRSGENPARWKGHLDHLLPAPNKVQKVVHHRALPIDDMPAFMRDLRSREGTAARALEFAILNASRSGEVRGALWSEIDLKAGVWVIPAERMKAGVQHRVPLSQPALDLLSQQPRFEDSELVFPAPRGGVLSDMTLTAVTRRMEVDAVPHGFRSTFRDWCAERTNFPRDLAETALAHKVESKVEAAYLRSDVLEKRRALMQAWADFCDGVQELKN
jgi:integrase